jgi:hypothetical protein
MLQEVDIFADGEPERQAAQAKAGMPPGKQEARRVAVAGSKVVRAGPEVERRTKRPCVQAPSALEECDVFACL